MQGSIYEEADEVEVKDGFARHPRLDEKDREGDRANYKLKFISAFSRGANRQTGKKGFFKATVEVLTAEGDNALPAGTLASILIYPRPFDGHIKDIKKLVAALTGTKPSTVSKENIDEIVADNPENGGAGEMTGVTFVASLERNKRGYMDINYTAINQN